MSKDFKGSSKHSASKGGSGSLLIGILIGLVLGLAIALAVAWYINKMPAPFLNRAEPAAKSGPQKNNGADLPGNNEKSGKIPETKPRFDFYKILPGSEEPVSEQQFKEAQQKPSTVQVREAFFLQAGAFQNAPDADNLKARLALLGLEATIQTTTLSDKGVWHRVRVGPYSAVDDLNRARDTLKQNGIETTLIKYVKRRLNHQNNATGGKGMMNPLRRLRNLAGLLAMLAMSSVFAQQPPIVGREYTRISPPQPVSSGNKIEVIEFFWYGCPHCYHLEPSLHAWLKRKSADVVFRYVPGTFGAPQWEPLTRTYYALDALSLADKYHDAIFAAIHGEKDANRQRALISDPRAIADWLGSKGVDKQKFLDTYSSFAVNGRTQRSLDMTRNYDVSGTPSLAIDGKYLTGPSMTVNTDNSVSYERFFQVVDQLIAQARKERVGKK